MALAVLKSNAAVTQRCGGAIPRLPVSLSSEPSQTANQEGSIVFFATDFLADAFLRPLDLLPADFFAPGAFLPTEFFADVFLAALLPVGFAVATRSR